MKNYVEASLSGCCMPFFYFRVVLHFYLSNYFQGGNPLAAASVDEGSDPEEAGEDDDDHTV